MQLSYGQMERALEAFLQISPERVSTFKSRIKQLQRLEFPSGVNVGRGAKMTYGAEHLFKLATAFELISLGLPAQPSTEIVERHWSVFRDGYGLAFLNASTPLEGWVIFCVRIEAFSMKDIQFSRGSRGSYKSKAFLEDQLAVANAIVSDKGCPRPSSIIVPVRAVFEEMARVIEPTTGLFIDPADDEFAAWIPRGDVEDADFIDGWPDPDNAVMRAKFGPPRDTPQQQEELESLLRSLKEKADVRPEA